MPSHKGATLFDRTMTCIVILRQSYLMSRNVMVIEIKRKQPLLTVFAFYLFVCDFIYLLSIQFNR